VSRSSSPIIGSVPTKQDLIDRTKFAVIRVQQLANDDDAAGGLGKKHDAGEWSDVGAEFEAIKAETALLVDMRTLDTEAWDQQLWDLSIFCQQRAEYCLINAMTIIEPLKDHTGMRIHEQVPVIVVR